MKTKTFLLVLLFPTLLMNCNKIDESLINNKEKLVSPYSQDVLHRYIIESSMAFGSGCWVIQILPSNEKCDYTKDDYFRFDNDYPFWVRWKSKDILMVKCLTDVDQLGNKQPIKKETKKWKNWTLEIEYYSMFSTGLGGDYSINNFIVDSNYITIHSKKESWRFKMSEIQISVDTNTIDLTHYKIDTFKTKVGITFTSYKFRNKTKTNNFIKQQIFVADK